MSCPRVIARQRAIKTAALPSSTVRAAPSGHRSRHALMAIPYTVDDDLRPDLLAFAAGAAGAASFRRHDPARAHRERAGTAETRSRAQVFRTAGAGSAGVRPARDRPRRL